MFPRSLHSIVQNVTAVDVEADSQEAAEVENRNQRYQVEIHLAPHCLAHGRRVLVILRVEDGAFVDVLFAVPSVVRGRHRERAKGRDTDESMIDAFELLKASRRVRTRSFFDSSSERWK